MAFKNCLVAFVALAVQMASASVVAAPGVTTCGCSSTVAAPVLQPFLSGCLSNLFRPVVSAPVSEIIMPPAPVVAPPVIPAPVVPAQFGASVLYDNTVSNNLANVLQLLVVSNLLDGTLPAAPCGVYRPTVNGCGTTVVY